MRRVAPVGLIILLCFGNLLAADPHFIKPVELDAVAMLPPPPVAGSDEAKTEVETVLKLQQTRTPADVARANAEAKLTPAAFSPVLGDAFTAKNLPVLFALLTDAAADSKLSSESAKTHYARQRPQFVDPQVKPSISGEVDASYPSGHATRGILWATILMEIAPDKKEMLIQRGEEIGWDRVLAGVHFPSDVYAGRILGQALAQAMKKDSGFQARLAKAKAEYETFKAAHEAGLAMPAVSH